MSAPDQFPAALGEALYHHDGWEKPTVLRTAQWYLALTMLIRLNSDPIASNTDANSLQQANFVQRQNITRLISYFHASAGKCATHKNEHWRWLFISGHHGG